jgi:hypothetical protein
MPCELAANQSPGFEIIDLSDSPLPAAHPRQPRQGVSGSGMLGAARRGPCLAPRRAVPVQQVYTVDSETDDCPDVEQVVDPVVLKPEWPEALCTRWSQRASATAAVKLDNTANGKQVNCQKKLSGSTRCVLRCATTLVKVRMCSGCQYVRF